MLPALIAFFMAASVHGNWDRAGGMSQPFDRVAAYVAIRLRDVRPVSILLKPEEYADSALVRALRQHDFVAFAE
jgi:hypothetical protein